jgi:FkbM family methyltransferase
MMAGLVSRLRFRRNGVDQDEIDTWRRKFEAFRAEVRARKLRDRQERKALKAQSLRRARRVPSVEALRHMMVARLPLAQRRAAQIEVQEPPSTAGLEGRARRTAVDGLTWWVPTPPTQSSKSVERTLGKLRFPYRTISQTRDVAIGGIMLDIGANNGRMAIPRAVLGDVTRVYCAEPDALNYDCLVANIRENRVAGLVIADCVAISDRVGRVALEHGKMSGSHRVDYTRPAQDDRLTVPSMTLDAWVDHHRIPVADVTFVKIDTQGSEVHVLSGASKLLAQPHIAWQIEVSPFHLRLAGSDPAALYRILTEQFSHFIDLTPDAGGPRLRRIGELPEALAYLDNAPDVHTDLVLYHARQPDHIA